VGDHLGVVDGGEDREHEHACGKSAHDRMGEHDGEGQHGRRRGRDDRRPCGVVFVMRGRNPVDVGKPHL
jgi:hypothetical protein